MNISSFNEEYDPVFLKEIAGTNKARRSDWLDKRFSPLRLLAISVNAIIVATAVAVMSSEVLIEGSTLSSITGIFETVFVALTLIVIVLPLQFFLSYQPLLRYMRQLERTDRQLYLLISAFESADDAIVITDRQGNVEWSNAAFTEMTGYPFEQALHQNLRLFESDQFDDVNHERLWETILSGQVWRGELLNRRRDGQLYTEEQIISPVRDEHGDISHFIFLKKDITSQKELESQIKRKDQELLTLTYAEQGQRLLAEGLIQVTLALNANLDLDGVLQRILAQTQNVTKCDAVAVSIYKENNKLEWLHRGLDDRSISQTVLETSIPMGMFTHEPMNDSFQPVRIGDTLNDPLWRRVSGFEWVKSYTAVSLIAENENECVGFLNLFSSQTEFFGKDTVNLLQAFAVHAVVAVRNAQLYQDALNARQTAETLGAASQDLAQSLSLDSVMNVLLDHLKKSMTFDSASVILIHHETRMAVRATQGTKLANRQAKDFSVVYNAQNSPHILNLLSSQKTIVISDTSAYPGWKPLINGENAGNWLGIPLIVNDKAIGLCEFNKIEPEFFTPSHISLAEALVGQAAVAIQNAWLFEQVRSGRERLQSLSHRLVEVQEMERRYISRELHDEAGQALASLRIGLHLLEREADRPEAIIAGVTDMKRQVETILENLHRLAADLRPVSLDHLGLVVAMCQYVEAISEKYGIVAEFEAVGFEDRLPSKIETAVYRIVQEALTNVLRHSQASRVDVILEQQPGKLVIIVEDNGVGFDPVAAMSSGRLGLVGIRERAEMLSGTLILNSDPGIGATLRLEIPYDNSNTYS